MARVIIELEVDGDLDDATYVIDEILESGLLQDAIADHDFDAGDVNVTSALVRGVEDDEPTEGEPDEDDDADDDVPPEPRDRTPRYFQPNTVAVIFDPDGGEHPCNELYAPEQCGGLRYWCAGRVGASPAELADIIHANWNVVEDRSYERAERSFGEGP